MRAQTSTIASRGLKLFSGSADQILTERISTMRLQLIAIPFLAVAAFGAPQAETTTYVDGNLTGISPNSGATLAYSADKQMTLRTGLTNIDVPYENITHAELGAVKETSHGHKLFGHHGKTQTQLLIVNFKNGEGEEKTMTLELAQPAAASVLSSIESHKAPQQVAAQEAAPAPPVPEQPAAKLKTRTKLEPKAVTKSETPAQSSDWWGDTWWKTSRNTEKWTKPASTNAPDQQ
jgi:hypothetical protein